MRVSTVDVTRPPPELAALDEHQVRRWTSWHRWTILALLAHAFLAVLAATQTDDQNPDDDQLIPLTCNQIRRLVTGLCQQPTAPRIQLHWSRWRRRHQYTSRACHCRHRAGSGPYNVTVTTRSRIDGALS